MKNQKIDLGDKLIHRLICCLKVTLLLQEIEQIHDTGVTAHQMNMTN